MVFLKLFTVVVTASSLWAVDAGKCKPHTSFLTLTSGASDSSLSEATIIDSAVSADATVIHISTFSGSFTTEILDEITKFGDSTTTTDTITIPIDTSASTDASLSTDTTIPTDSTEITEITLSASSDALYETIVSVELSKSIEQTTTADIVISTQSTSAGTADTTETTAITETSILMDVTTAEFTTVSALETASKESLSTSTTTVSCPVYSNVVNDSSFEEENDAPNKWELGLQFSGTAVTYQKQSSTSQEVPRAHSGDQFVLLGTNVGTDMRRVVSLDSKQYQLWITYAAISDPDEDWSFNFIVATSYNHATRQTINVPKASPFMYRQESTIFRGRIDDSISVLARPLAGSKPRLIAIDDIYVAEYVPSCVTPTVKTELCGAIQGVTGSAGQPYRIVNLDQGNEEICAQLCTKDESCVTFGWQVEQYFKACKLFKYTKDKLEITIKQSRGTVFYDRSCWQCTGLDCSPS